MSEEELVEKSLGEDMIYPLLEASILDMKVLLYGNKNN
jgi:hypothetical protein